MSHKSLKIAVIVLIAMVLSPLVAAQGQPPQAVVLEVEKVTEPTEPGDLRMVRIKMHGIDGLDRVVIERLRQGSRAPSRFEVYDFKKGYFETDVDADRSTQFTPIAYNAYGSTRGEPVTVEAASAGIALVPSANAGYRAYAVTNPQTPVRLAANADGTPDTSPLTPGIYIVVGRADNSIQKILVK